jgi:hypothetical protein
MHASQGHDGTFAAAHAGRWASEHLRRLDDDPGCEWRDGDPDEPLVWQPTPGASVVVPGCYAGGYDYPLLVTLADRDATHAAHKDWLSRVSDRNYVGLSLSPRLTSAIPTEAPASGRAAWQRCRSLLSAVESEVTIDPRRRFLIGRGTTCDLALRWLLQQPGLFAGAILIDPEFDDVFVVRAEAPSQRTAQVLWLDSRKSEAESASDPRRIALGSLGVRVSDGRVFARTTTEATINHWVLSQIPTAIIH